MALNERQRLTLGALSRIEHEMNSYIVGQREALHGSIVALLARQHVFFLGPPGSGKSFISAELARRVRGGQYFKITLNQFTTPEQLFGPPSIAGMRDRDEYRFVTKFRLPEAFIAQIDEIWKANPAIINTMLSITNEREFENGGEIVPVPLNTMFVTSNEEPPDGNDLLPMYDRILLRYHLLPLSDREERQRVARFNNVYRLALANGLPIYERGEYLSGWKILIVEKTNHLASARDLAKIMIQNTAEYQAMSTEQRAQYLTLTDDTALQRLNTVHHLAPMSAEGQADPVQIWAAIETLRGQIHYAAAHNLTLPYRTFVRRQDITDLYPAILEVEMPPLVEEAFYDILDKVASSSVRRENDLRVLVQAAALFRHPGAATAQVEVEDLAILTHCLWRKAADLDEVRQIVDEVCNTSSAEVASILDAITEEVADNPHLRGEIDPAEFVGKISQVNAYVKQLESIEKQFPNNPSVSEALARAKHMRDEFQDRWIKK